MVVQQTHPKREDSNRVKVIVSPVGRQGRPGTPGISIRFFDTLQEALDLQPRPENGVTFQVREETDPENFGFYVFDDREPEGYRYLGERWDDEYLSQIENRIDAFEQDVEGRVQGLETRVEGVETDVSGFKAEVEDRVEGVETDVSGFKTEVNQRVDEVEDLVVGIGSGEGGKAYDSLAEALSADIPDNVVFQTPEGLWRRDSSLPEGAEFLREHPAKPGQLGFEVIPRNTNILENYSLDFEDENYWGKGILNAQGQPQDQTTGWRHTVEYLPVYPGIQYSSNVGIYGNAKLIIYDSDKTIIQVVDSAAEFEIPDNGRFIRTSKSSQVNEPYISNDLPVYLPSDEVFVTPEKLRQEKYEIKTDVKTDVGFEVIPASENIIPDLENVDFNNTELFSPGYLKSDGSVEVNTSWVHTVKFYPILEGEFVTDAYVGGAAVILIYNSDKEVVRAISEIGSPNFEIQNDLIFTEDEKFIRFSISPSRESTYLRPKNDMWVPTDSVFITPQAFEERLTDRLEKFGMTTIPAGDNLFDEFIKNAFDDEYWGAGILNAEGNVQDENVETYWHTRKYIKVVPGQYRFRSRLGQKSVAVLYDEYYNIHSVIDRVGWPVDEVITIPEGVKYIRTTYQGGLDLIPSTFGLITHQDIYLGNSEVSEAVNLTNRDTPVSGFAVANTMKDIFKASNPAKPKIPMVSFISDDGQLENDEWYVPILDEKGIKSSFAIVTGWFTNSGSYSAERVQELSRDGHDIISHTHTHERMYELTDEEVDYILQKSKLELKKIGEDAELFVSPYGNRDARIDSYVRKYYKANFISRYIDESPNVPPINSLYLKRVGFDDPNEEKDLDFYKQAVDAAVAQGGWLIFAIHPQYPEYLEDTNPDGYLQRRQELRDLIDYIQSLDVPILTAKQAWDIYKNPVELGHQTVDSRWYALGMDGSESGNYFE